MPAPATESTPESGSPLPLSIVEPYLKIQSELARDSIETVRANAGNFATAATSLGSPAMKLDMAAVQLAAATTLPEARQRFGVLSDALVTYMDGLDLVPPDGVFVAECEDTRRRWLQQGESIANPYDTASGCGTFR
jgi:hypothetical protein